MSVHIGPENRFDAPVALATHDRVLELLNSRGAIHTNGGNDQSGGVANPMGQFGQGATFEDRNFSLEWGHTIDRDWNTIDDEVKY